MAGLRVDGAGMRALASRWDRSVTTAVAAADTALDREARKLPAAARASARSRLPSRGGLGGLVAGSAIPVEVSHSAQSFRVRVVVNPGPVKRPGQLDRGRARHPLFGRRSTRSGRSTLYLQRVPRDWFTAPARDAVASARAAARSAWREHLRG